MNPKDNEAYSQALKEFNLSHKSYLENKLLLTILYDTLTRNEANEDVKNFDLNRRVQENFWKSYLLVDQNNASNKELFKNEPLSADAKSLLLSQIESRLEEYFIEINKHLKFANSPSQNDTPNEDDSGMQHSFHKSMSASNLNSDAALAKVKQLIDANKADKSKIEKMNQEIDVKVQHFFKKSLEIFGLLKKILSELKIDFYANSAKIELEHEILSCESLFKKMDQVKSQMTNELYKQDQVKSLSIIKSQIELERNKSNDELIQLKTKLESFKSLGKEFDTILAGYLDLKKQYEMKMLTLAKLKGEEN